MARQHIDSTNENNLQRTNSNCIVTTPCNLEIQCGRFSRVPVARGSFARLGSLANFGEGGIRTLGALLELGALAKLCFQPLSHLTSKERTKLSGLCATRQMLNRGSARPVQQRSFPAPRLLLQASTVSLVRVKVPASTANLGPGFDCLGIALRIYNWISIERGSLKNRTAWWRRHPQPSFIALESGRFLSFGRSPARYPLPRPGEQRYCATRCAAWLE